jgi:hypothetical protein
MNAVTHHHPRLRLDHVIQWGALVVVVLIGVGVLGQIGMALLAPSGALRGLALFGALATGLLAFPVLMLTAVAPAVSVDAAGITLQPVIWKARRIPWEAVRAVKPYPLLPIEDAEVTRRLAVGRRNYRPASGIMLVIPGLPPQYRIAGFLAGERAAPVVALTNRAHTDYDNLLHAVLTHTEPTIHDPELAAE